MFARRTVGILASYLHGGSALATGDGWTVAEIDGTSVVDDSVVTAEFEPGRLAGSARCNRYSAAVEQTAALGSGKQWPPR